MSSSTKSKLLEVLESMPPEAFGWIVVAIYGSIFPDGLGGFKPESRASILKAKKTANAYINDPVNQ